MEIKNIVLLVVFIFGLVYMQMIYAQTVDDIINKYTRERGGKEKLNSIYSLIMEGTRQMMGNEVAVKVTRVQGKLFRNDFEFGSSFGYSIVTPFEGWSFISMRSPKAETMPEQRLKFMQHDLDIAGPLIDYAAKGNKAELAGKENIDGQEAYKIKLTLINGATITYLLHAENYLVIQTRQMLRALDGNGEKEVITNYTNYKAVDGMLFPHTISNPGDGPDAGSTTFNLIEVDKTIDESRYKPVDYDY